MDIIEKVRATIDRHDMLQKGDRVLVAVSGGPDSVALLHLLWRLRKDLNLSLHLAHFNHGLRGSESEADSHFVSGLAENFDLPLTIERADVAAIVRDEGGTLEAVARALRYRFLQRTAAQIGAAKIATGHTADDRAETTLMWLLRGTGPTGLRSIPPLRDGLIIRPLIDVTRREIEAYIEEQNLAWRLDSSNLDRRHFRNKIRSELLPLLKREYSPRIVEQAGRLAEMMEDEEHFFSGEMKRLLPKIVLRGSGRKIILDIQALSVYHIALKRRILRHAICFLKGDLSDIHFRHVQLLLEAVHSGKDGLILDLPGDLVAEKTGGSIIIRRGKTVAFDRQLVVPGKTNLPEIEGALQAERVEGVHIHAGLRMMGNETAFFDYRLMTGPLRVRTRHQGDVFHPLGMAGSKKLQDFFVDEKIPRLERQEVPLLTAGGEIAWIVGRRVSETFKVRQNTQEMLKVTFMRWA